MTIKEALTKYHKVEIDLLLAFVLKKSREFLFMTTEHKLSSYQAVRLSRLIKRRLQGEPMAYILGYKDFYGFRFKVNKDVLIPRPETEWLIDKIKNQILKIKITNQKLKILDMGTGSGCIAVSLAKQFPISPSVSSSGSRDNFQFPITASDILKEVLRVAKENTKRHKVKIKFIKSNLFNRIKGKFDITIANLPYVTNKNYELGIRNLEFEPKAALTDGTNQWKIYQEFFKQLPHHLNPLSIVLLEIDPQAKKYLSSWAKKYLPQGKVKFYRDLNNLWRYMEILSSTFPRILPRSAAYKDARACR